MKHLLILLLTTTLTFIACKKDPEDIAALVSESEVAEMVETALSSRTAGLENPTVDLAKLIESSLGKCGVPGDTTLAKSKSGAVSYNYTYDLGWVVNCNTLNIPQNATTTLKGNVTFGTTRWDGHTQGDGSLTFTGLAPSEPNYLANGSYTATGTLTGDFRNQYPTLNCTTELTLSNLAISKSTYTITGGTGTVKVIATAANGKTQTLDGTLVFNANGTVTVTINGHTHTF